MVWAKRALDMGIRVSMESQIYTKVSSKATAALAVYGGIETVVQGASRVQQFHNFAAEFAKSDGVQQWADRAMETREHDRTIGIGFD